MASEKTGIKFIDGTLNTATENKPLQFQNCPDGIYISKITESSKQDSLYPWEIPFSYISDPSSDSEHFQKFIEYSRPKGLYGTSTRSSQKYLYKFYSDLLYFEIPSYRNTNSLLNYNQIENNAWRFNGDIWTAIIRSSLATGTSTMLGGINNVRLTEDNYVVIFGYAKVNQMWYPAKAILPPKLTTSNVSTIKLYYANTYEGLTSLPYDSFAGEHTVLTRENL